MKATPLSHTIGYKVKPLNMPLKWNKFLGQIPSNVQWTMLLTGPSFGGKSSFALKLADMLSRSGRVLYINAEENLAGGTIQSKARALKISSPTIHFWDNCELNSIKQQIDTGKYKFVIMDSISKIAMFNQKTVMDLFMLHNDYKEQAISFISVLFSLKGGKSFKGENDVLHLAEVVIHAEDGIADCHTKNRYLYKKIKKDMEFPIFNN